MDILSADSRIFRQILALMAQAVVAIACAWFLVFSFGKTVVNAGQSMQPLLESGDSVLIDRVSYRFFPVRRYDVAAFYMTQADREADRASIKRIIGMPGETIQIEDGRVLINGQTTDCPEGWLDADTAGAAAQPIVLGADEYFVLGDNRSASEDSRFASVGNVKESSILGRVWLQVRPLSRAKLIKRRSKQE